MIDGATIMTEDGSIKPTLMMLQGLPASGKTTHARQLQNQGNWVRVNKDDLRAMMDNSVHSKSNEKRIIRTRNTIIIDALTNGKNVVVDDTNFNPVHAANLKQLAELKEAEFHVRFIDTPLDMCLSRNEQRASPVPVSVITDMYAKYIEKPVKQAENASESNPEEDLPECIIVDVDGTLAHIDEDNPRNVYDASRAHEDKLDDAVSNVVNMAHSHGYHVMVLTGRSRAHQEVTETWLKANGVNYDEIHTRKDDDRRKDTIVKQEMYEAFVEGKFKVKYVIDDRPSVCRMWRELGLKTLQVGNPHDEF